MLNHIRSNTNAGIKGSERLIRLCCYVCFHLQRPPHEHNGSGTPKSEALITGHIPPLPRCASISFGDISTDIMPATKKPNSRYGDMTVNVIQNCCEISIRRSIMFTEPFPSY